MIHTVKGFGIVNKAEINIFLELSCFFHDPVDIGDLISGSSAFCKARLNIWKFTVHVLLKPGLENFEHYFTSVWDECNCLVVWTFFGIGFLWDWNENWPFPVLWPLLSFPHMLPQINSFTLSLESFSSDPDNCHNVEVRPLLQFPHPPRAGPVLLTLLFFSLFPLSYQVFHDPIYSFPLVRYSCALSTGVLHALLCLKVYSWCIHGERCTSHPPTPLPFCYHQEVCTLICFFLPCSGKPFVNWKKKCTT